MSRTSQDSSLKGRMRRADRLRPLVKREVDKSSVREVEELSGVSRTVIHEFVGGRTPQEENLRELERWAESAGLYGDEATGGTPSHGSHRVAAREEGRVTPDAEILRELWRRLDRIDEDQNLTPLQRSIKQERELAAYRTSTQDRESRIAEVRAQILERELELAGERTRSLEGTPGFEFIEPLERDERTRALFEAEQAALAQETRDRLARIEGLLRAAGLAAS